MIIINDIECTIETVYDVISEIVHQTKTIDELYEIDIEIVAENQLEIMCIFEQIVTEHAFKLFADEYETDVDEIEMMYDDIASANRVHSISEIIDDLKRVEQNIIDNKCNEPKICNDE